MNCKYTTRPGGRTRTGWLKQALLMCAMALFGSAQAQVDVTASGGTAFATYANLNGAFVAINAGTHTGVITIDITASVVEAGACVLNSSGAGSASYTSILLRPTVDGVTVSGATLAGRGLIELNGADNVTIDGDNPNTPGINRNLTLTNAAANTLNYTSVVRLATSTLITSVNDIIIRNCIINGSATGLNTGTNQTSTSPMGTTYGIVAAGGASTVAATTAPSALASNATNMATGQTANNFLVDNCAINACGRAISAQATALGVFGGPNSLRITNNLVGNPTTGATTQVYAFGINVSGYTTGSLISGNTVYVEGQIGTSTAAIALGLISAVGNNMIVENNKVLRKHQRNTGWWGSTGINLAGGSSPVGVVVRNNFVANVNNDLSGSSLSSTFGTYGIRIAAGTGWSVYHNSVNLYGPVLAGTGQGLSAALIMTATSQTNCDIRNNILSNTLSGGGASSTHASLALPLSGTAAMNLNLNNNAYYCNVGANAGILQVGTAFAAANLYTAANFNAGATTPSTNSRAYTSVLSGSGNNDNASFASSAAAPFLSNTDLHIDGTAPGAAPLNASGATGLGLLFDIDGDFRGTPPEIGADEFNPAPCASPSASATVQQDCALNQYFVNVTVTSLNGAPSVDVVSNYTGNPGADLGVGTGTYQIGPFPSNANVTVSVLHNGNPVCDLNLGQYNYDCSVFGQNALSFDGVDDRVNCGDAASVQITGNQITLEAWIYPTAWRASSFEGSIINKEPGGNGGYMIRCGNNGQMSFNFGAASGWVELQTATGTFTLNNWQHVAATYDGANMRIYRNGVQVASQAATALIGPAPGQQLTIGNWSQTNARGFIGKIDEARVWNVARSAGDIGAFQMQQLCGTEPGLVAYYAFDQGVDGANNAGVTTLNDATPNLNNGTLLNFALNGPTSNWVLGKTGVNPCSVCAGTPTAGAITGNGNACTGVSNSLTLSGATFGIGITLQWKYGPVGGPYTNLLGTTLVQNTSGLPVGTWEVVVDVTCSAGPSTSTTLPFALTVNATPTATASAGPACLGQPLNFTGTTDIGTSFLWTGPSGFNNTNQNPTIASLAAANNGTYTFVATANGCNSAPSTVSISGSVSPSLGPVTASPAVICPGGSSQLNASATVPTLANQMVFAHTTGAALDPMTGATNLLTAANDDSPSGLAPIGFTFNFNGSGHTQFSLTPDGFLRLGSVAAVAQFTNSVTSTTNNPNIYPYWDDVALGGAGLGGYVRYLTDGVPGNRILKVEWFVTIPRNLTGTPNSTFQCWLYEANNRIEFRYGTMAASAMSASVGITAGSSNYQSVTIATNTVSTTVANDANGGQPPAGTMYSFTPISISSLNWSPATYLDNPGILTPFASGVTPPVTYTFTATASNGCAASGTATVALDNTDTDGDGTIDCFDGCPTDPNKIAPGQCGCGVPDTDTDGDGTADCNDGCPLDPNKIAPGLCGCGVPDTDTDGDGTPDCNDGCPLDPNKIAPGICGCGVSDVDTDGDGLADCIDNCPLVPGVIGSPCDDGNPLTIGDALDANCVCVGIACPTNPVTLELTTDANGSETSWEIVPSGGGAPICSGSGFSDNSFAVGGCCLPTGCFDLRVLDSFGDGMCCANGLGGYVLRTGAGKRIIDNFADGSFGSVSQAGNSFCLPIGTDELVATSCDRTDLIASSVIQVTPNPAVTSGYQAANSGTGYQFWIFNPDGGYSRRVFQSHNAPGTAWPLGTPNGEKCSFLRLEFPTQPVPSFTLLNVRVRSRLNTVYGEFGPACRMFLDPTAGCTTTQLTSTPNPIVSCGATGVTLDIQQGSTIWADVVPLANRYRFSFTAPGYLRNIVSPNRSLVVAGWQTNPLQCGVTYDVQVRASFDNGATYCPAGPVCQVSIVPCNPAAAGRTVDQGGVALGVYPNPNRGDLVTLQLSGLPETEQQVQVEIMDMHGRMVVTRSYAAASLLNTTIDLGGSLASGLYNVNVTFGTERLSQRLVIQ
ncbi:MAG: T9SS type A sorting domain-containing protein [Flavobacteriales bacterium]|nr:T9SS type A sorting domain-containing protein [Flavobacteriales bacterium]